MRNFFYIIEACQNGQNFQKCELKEPGREILRFYIVPMERVGHLDDASYRYVKSIQRILRKIKREIRDLSSREVSGHWPSAHSRLHSLTQYFSRKLDGVSDCILDANEQAPLDQTGIRFGSGLIRLLWQEGHQVLWRPGASDGWYSVERPRLAE